MGIDTKPNEMVPEEIARAGMSSFAFLGGTAPEGSETVGYHRPVSPCPVRRKASLSTARNRPSEIGAYFLIESFTPETPAVRLTPRVFACRLTSTPFWFDITKPPAPPPTVAPAAAAV